MCVTSLFFITPTCWFLASVFAHCQGVCRLTFSDPVSQFVFLYGQKMCLCVLEIILDYFQPLDAAVVLLYIFRREGLTQRND